jgi:hypothetical protein
MLKEIQLSHTQNLNLQNDGTGGSLDISSQQF